MQSLGIGSRRTQTFNAQAFLDSAGMGPNNTVISRWVPAAEVAVITGSILLFIWVVQPLGGPGADLAFRLAIVVLMLLSNLSHGDSRRRMGLRLDNLMASARLGLPATAIAAGVVVMLGLILAPSRPDYQRLLLNFGYYLLWGFAQQYALQAVVFLRLVDAGLTRRAPAVAAALFALVHAPNPGLMAMTFAGGWMWCSVFRRQPNLVALTASHACLAVIAEAMLPLSVTGGYRIGPRYLRWIVGR